MFFHYWGILRTWICCIWGSKVFMTIGIVSDNSCRLMLIHIRTKLQSALVYLTLPPTQISKQQNAWNHHSPPAGWPERQTPTTQAHQNPNFQGNKHLVETKVPETPRHQTPNFQNIRVTKHKMSKFKYRQDTEKLPYPEETIAKQSTAIN